MLDIIGHVYTQTEKVHWFFEGAVEKVNARAGPSEKKLRSTLGTLVRQHLGVLPKSERDQRKWSWVVGRPDWIVTQWIIAGLQRQRYFCFGREEMEADQQIALWSCQQPDETDTVVVGTDSDYLAFAPRVCAVVCPKRSDLWIVRKSDVLVAAGVDARQFMLLYALCGCDNVSSSGMRYEVAKKFVKALPFQLEKLKNLKKLNLSWLIPDEESRKAIHKQVSALWVGYGWKEPRPAIIGPIQICPKKLGAR